MSRLDDSLHRVLDVWETRDFGDGEIRDILDVERHEANARLIAAAPEMLSALELAIQALNTAPRFKVGANEYGIGGTDSYKIATVVEAAIAKARGET